MNHKEHELHKSRTKIMLETDMRSQYDHNNKHNYIYYPVDSNLEDWNAVSKHNTKTLEKSFKH